MSRAVLLLAILTWCASPSPADEYDRLKVGLQSDGRIVVPTNQILKPAGQQVAFPGRPVDLALTDGGRTLVVKNIGDLVFVDVPSGEIKQTLTLPPKKDRKRAGFGVVGLIVTGDSVFASDSEQQIRVARKNPDGLYEWGTPLPLPAAKVGGLPHPAGIARLPDGSLLVTLTRDNSVVRIDPAADLSKETTIAGAAIAVQRHPFAVAASSSYFLAPPPALERVAVGVAPYTVRALNADKAYVSNWGGDPPKEGDPTGTTSGTPIRVDPRTGVANHGTVSVLRRRDGKWQQTKTIAVGLHPSGMALSSAGTFLYVANANSDTVSVIDTKKDVVVETIDCRPEGGLPFGSGCNAVALSPTGAMLYVANGTNNCVAVVRLSDKSSEGVDVARRPPKSAVAGLIPTGWYPGAIVLSRDGKRLFVANVKGHGAIAQPKTRPEKRNTYDHLGTISIIETPGPGDLADHTKEVNRNNRLGYSIAGLEKPRPDAKPIPVPQRHGEPSVFKHVIYVIKENRTYDQVFGDMKEGNGNADLAIFGEEVTPNHHALARQFTLFDNFYCSGVLSADGHTWINEAYVSDYLEKAFGGFTRSYPDDGSDPLAYVPTGFLWDNALAHKKTFRNYGEYVKNEFPKNAKWSDFYADYKNGTRKMKVTAKANLKSLEPYTHPEYPWFPLLMQDVYKAKIFIDELKQFEKKGEFPNLIYVTLPADHTDGTRPGYPTPRAMVADNDLALGQLVEAVSHSKFWPETCIFVVEDDPQDGYDHVDGHRTVALVISPYTKRQHVDSTNYNQTGMVKSIELLLGLPPMNQMDLGATPMRTCFMDKPDLTPYKVVPNRIKLDEMNPDLRKLTGKARYWAEKSLEMDLDDGDEADEDTLNRILWHSVKGYETPYPERFTRQGSE